MLIHQGNVELQALASIMDTWAERIILLATQKANGYVQSRSKRKDQVYEYSGVEVDHSYTSTCCKYYVP